jgi:environmental stress-induced protein Ves
MTRRLVRPADHRVMPWKNGGGSTAEIALAPEGADLATGFDWRLSIATIERNGPFSAFPGHDRTIMLIEGAGMVLDFGGGKAERIAVPFEPFEFVGEAAVECRLLGGRIRDFNLMVRRAGYGAECHVVELADEPLALATDGGTLLIHCLEGDARLDDTPLASGETLILEGETGVLGELTGDETATVFVAALFPRG